MRITRGETYKAIVYSRIENSNEYEELPSFEFSCRVANDWEKSEFRPTMGLFTEGDNVTLYATNIPHEIKVHDRVVFLGKEYLVQSVGYYLTKNRFINASIFSEDKIFEQSPKGIVLG